MNFNFSNKSLYFFFGISALIIVAPLYDLIIVLKELYGESLSDILNQSKNVKLLIKRMATLGVLLLISFFVYSYAFCAALFDKKIRIPIVIIFSITYIWSGFGYIFSHQTALQFRESNKNFKNITAQDKIIIDIKFKEFPAAFYQDLLKVKQGQLKLLINQRIFSLTSHQSHITFQGKPLKPATPYALKQSELEMFIKNKKLRFFGQGNNATLELRDLKGSPMKSRADTLYINNKIVSLESDQAFFVAFYFTTLNGRVLKIYV